ncbi:oxidoreductase [Pseudomonas phoenicis]|uniref:oxidoreductase n=1 Tax=unclassified Pseudomonas TaxID=196821 RepID=UPI0039A149C8
MTDTRLLDSPMQIGSLSLKNRYVVAPMTRVSASEGGDATEVMGKYYERFAAGGFGLVISEGLYTDQRFAQGYRFQPGMSDEAQALSWRPLVRRLQTEGTRVIGQLMHAGALSQGNRHAAHTIAPSPVQPKGEQMAFYRGVGRYPLPHRATDAQLAEVIAGFAQAARLATEVAGFDGVEIHGANGYLLDQFLTDYTNARDDRWGGAIERRVGLLMEVVGAVKDAVRPGALVGVRISQGKVNDFEHKWPEAEHAAEVIFGALAKVGVDYIHVTEHQAWQPAFAGGSATLIQLARRFAPDTPLIGNGSLRTAERSIQVLAQGADLLAFGRSALANPDLPQRFARDHALAELNAEVLGPIAHIKACELGG